MNSLKELQEAWVDKPEFHSIVNESFIKKVNENDSLRIYRDYIEQTASGFGERSFTWLHKLLVDEFGKELTIVEIGVYKGAILALYEVLSNLTAKTINRYGITPLDSTDGHLELDYAEEIVRVHKGLDLTSNSLVIIQGKSQDPAVVNLVQEKIKCEILYIDGHHGYTETLSDLRNYDPILKSGGYLIIDDSCNDMKMPWGYFQGIQSVTDALLDFMKECGDRYEFIGNVVHNRIYRKK